MKLTTRGRVLAYLVVAALVFGLLFWADAAMHIPGVDDAVVDAEQLQ